VGKEVMLAHYVRVLREKSNRAHRRILAALPAEVAYRSGHVADRPSPEEQLRHAVEARDWQEAARLSALLGGQKEPPAA